MWVGAKEHSKYGCIRVTWPDGTKCIERAHRVAYITEHKVLKEEMCQGKKREVSHLCYNTLCVNTDQLCLESHVINMERSLCKSRRQCSALHEPFCLF